MAATKLKNLEVTKVDFVDEGANPDAHIKLFKRKIESDNEAVQQDGHENGLIKKITKALTEVFRNEKIEKKEEAESFSEKIGEVKRRKVIDEMWDLCYALQSSLASIMSDEDVDRSGACEMMKNSISEFDSYILDAIDAWSSGKTVGIVQKKCTSVSKKELENMNHVYEMLGDSIKKAKQKEKLKGELEEMIKIDKSKMSPEEVSVYEDIIKKYGVETEEPSNVVKTKKVAPEDNEEEIEEEETEKGKRNCAKSIVPPNDEAENIYKGLHPAVVAELEALKKHRDAAETRELTEVAKKYELIGKKPEELVPTLKSLKEAGGTAYTDMISVLDSALAMAETSGAFSEIGKSKFYTSPVAKSAPETKVDAIAKGYMEKDPSLTFTDAVAKAWENNPDLMAAYEEEAGF